MTLIGSYIQNADEQSIMQLFIRVVLGAGIEPARPLLATGF